MFYLEFKFCNITRNKNVFILITPYMKAKLSLKNNTNFTKIQFWEYENK